MASAVAEIAEGKQQKNETVIAVRILVLVVYSYMMGINRHPPVSDHNGGNGAYADYPCKASRIRAVALLKD